MRILLTGAAGNVGMETLKCLLDMNYDVTALELDNRKTRQKLRIFKDRVNIVYGSINDKKLVNSLICNKDVVIHLAAIIPPLADKKPALAWQVNYEGTLNIVDAIKRQKRKPFLIYSSSISIYGDRVEDYNIKVGDTLKPSEGDYYAETKIASEKLISKSLIPYSIFRLTGIMGYPAADPLMFHMPLDTKLEIASNVDTGYALAVATKHLKELNGKIFNLGGGDKCRTTYREFLTKMFLIYGLNVTYLKDTAFATKNFHCGYYIDSNKLNDILHFQRDTLDTYYGRVRSNTKGVVRFFSRMFSRLIIYFLQNQSDPLKAKIKKDKKSINRYFSENKLND